MTVERMIELLEIEKECVLRNASGECNRYCAGCDLLQDDTELHEMYTEVIDLLQAQAPRVMTLEEVHTSEICWYENSSNYGYYVGHIVKEKLGYKLRTKYLKIGSTIVHVNFDEDYNKAWRCWTSLPDQATREAAPWN